MPLRPIRAALALIALAPACHRETRSRRIVPARAPSSDDAPVTLAPSSTERVPPRPAEGCPALARDAGVGTMHGALVARDETWTAEGSPHRFPQGVTIAPGASVSIVACTTLAFGAGTALRVSDGAALVVQGEAARPVRMGLDERARSGPWAGVVFDAHARPTSRLLHASIEGAGAPREGVGACLYDAMAELDVNHVSIDGCVGHGVVLAGDASFRAESSALVIRHVTAAVDAGDGAPLVLGSVEALPTLPTLTLSDNAQNAIELGATDERLRVRHSVRVPARGAPYRVLARGGIDVGSDADPVLTIEPGVEIRLPPGAPLRVGVAESAGLIALASGDSGAALRADGSQPWGGLYLGARIDPEKFRLDRLVVSHASGAVLDDVCVGRDAAPPSAAAIHWLIAPPAGSINLIHVADLPEYTSGWSVEWRTPAGSFEANAFALPPEPPGAVCESFGHRDVDGGCFPAPPCLPPR